MARVLVVDDDCLVRRGLHRLLERAGHEVWETSGAKVALELLAERPMDLVITDLYMPGMNGVEFITRLGDRGQQSHVIAMTGGGYRRPEELLEEAAGVGAERTLVKPFQLQELEEAVNALIGACPAVSVPSQPAAATTCTSGRWRPASPDMAEH